MNKTLKFIASVALISLLIIPAFSGAQTSGGDKTFTPLISDYSGFKGTSDLANPKTQSFAELLNWIFKIAIAAAIILAVLRVVWGGFMYITNELWQSKSAGKQIIYDAIFGLFIALISWIILAAINKSIFEPTSPFLRSSPSAGQSSQNIIGGASQVGDRTSQDVDYGSEM